MDIIKHPVKRCECNQCRDARLSFYGACFLMFIFLMFVLAGTGGPTDESSYCVGHTVIDSSRAVTCQGDTFKITAWKRL